MSKLLALAEEHWRRYFGMQTRQLWHWGSCLLCNVARRRLRHVIQLGELPHLRRRMVCVADRSNWDGKWCDQKCAAVICCKISCKSCLPTDLAVVLLWYLKQVHKHWNVRAEECNDDHQRQGKNWIFCHYSTAHTRRIGNGRAPAAHQERSLCHHGARGSVLAL
jgi:hypothetical protein